MTSYCFSKLCVAAISLATDKRELERLCGNAKLEIKMLRAQVAELAEVTGEARMKVMTIEITEETKAVAVDAVAEALGGYAYDCTRVWQAWSAGTMTEDDFVRVADDHSRLCEIVDAVIAALTPNNEVSEGENGK